MHHYLLDLENVGASSLKSVKNLPGTAHVHLFCTEKSAKLSPEALVALNSVGHTFYAIPSGPQALDKHLLSSLGFLIGKEGNGSTYTVVSKDKGYDAVIAHWRTTRGVSVNRTESLVVPEKRGKASDTSESASKTKQQKATGKKAGRQKREHQIRCYFGAHFKEKKYHANKEKIIKAVLEAKTKVRLNAELQKRFKNDEVKEVYGRLKPLIEDLPGSRRPNARQMPMPFARASFPLAPTRNEPQRPSSSPSRSRCSRGNWRELGRLRISRISVALTPRL